MFRLFVALVGLAALSVVAFSLVGCQPEATPTRAPSTEPEATPASAEDQKEIEAALAELSPEDRKVAEAQKICPVSGEPLGSMGKPIKVTVEDKEIFICCEHCEDSVKENPEKYLSKLGK